MRSSKVGFFGPNDITLEAAVDCRFESPIGDVLLVAMIVFGGGRLDLCLEGIHSCPANEA